MGGKKGKGKVGGRPVSGGRVLYRTYMAVKTTWS
jgi:hypothetical protein